ncbi:chorismate-binding protein [Sphaerisporangium sp. NPDC088356]|uniref:anthranilate synthase family protein n=1 Tax=Sphaerisporangium sp. NPDC088356 TaxID=3154871 RepID=UPI0034153641
MPSDKDRFIELLDGVLNSGSTTFALLYRPEAVGRRLEILLGDVTTVSRLADLPLPDVDAVRARPGHEVLVMVPYRQIGERGFSCHDDQAPLLALTVRDYATCPLDHALPRLPDAPIELVNTRFDVGDEEYASIVGEVLAREIGNGAGSNFVIKRAFTAEIADASPRVTLSLFRRLLTGERSAYWTFAVHTGERTFVGATPERHVSLFNGTAVMNPISGTFRYPPSGPALGDLMEFLADPKEAGELYMVVDEELKMMARITAGGGRVVGPYLREMATLAHTEYLIKGRTSRDVREILRETMFAPTVTGSPLASACRVIQQYEPKGRGYYSGIAALISRDINGGRSLDSAILLRTAEITGGRLDISVGATLVRDSDPASEVAETHAKARGLLSALGIEKRGEGPGRSLPSLNAHPEVERALRARNAGLAAFWLDGAGQEEAVPGTSAEDRGRVLIVDAEDDFTAMIGHQLRALGLRVEVRRWNEAYEADDHDLVVMGPGPGDPRDTANPRIARLRETMRAMVSGGTSFIAVCLSHQILGAMLGFEVVRRDRPNQGVQQEIDYFGRRVRMGFYNTFVLSSASDEVRHEDAVISVSREAGTGYVHGLAGPGFRSMQFHVESVLSEHGPSVLADTVAVLLSGSRPHEEEAGRGRVTPAPVPRHAEGG